MRVLITGASGFVGSHLVEYLKPKGIQIRCLIQPGDASHVIAGTPGIECVSGDLKDARSLNEAARNCHIVIHAAAIARYNASLPEDEYQSVNVQGTRWLLEASLKNGVKRFVYISTIEAVGPSDDGHPLTEKTVCRPRNVYGRSKLEGERVVQGFISGGLDCVIVRLGTTYGPRERLAFQRIFKPISKGIYCLFGDGSALMEFSYVKNQVEGIWLAAEKGRSGEIYFLSDARPYSYKEVMNHIGEETGVKLHLISMPLVAAWLAAVVCEWLSRILRFYPFYIKETGRPPFSRKTLQWAARSSMFCNISKAKDELGHAPRYSLQQGLEETVAWYRAEGWL